MLWFMGTAELTMAERADREGAWGYGNTIRPDVMPPGSEPWVKGRYGSVHRPVASGGFAIRSVNGRLVIEILD